MRIAEPWVSFQKKASALTCPADLSAIGLVTAKALAKEEGAQEVDQIARSQKYAHWESIKKILEQKLAKALTCA